MRRKCWRGIQQRNLLVKRVGAVDGVYELPKKGAVPPAPWFDASSPHLRDQIQSDGCNAYESSPLRQSVAAVRQPRNRSGPARSPQAELLLQFSAVTKTDCLSVGLAFSDDLLDATVECLALLLHSAETKSDCRQGDGGNNGGGDLNDAVGEHRLLLSTALVGGFLVGVLVAHGEVKTARTLWTMNVP